MTLAELKALLYYDPETGIFTWVSDPGRKSFVGKEAGSKDRGYVRIIIRRKHYYAHRLAWFYVTGAWPEQEIDHKIGKSNAWGNLREASSSMNKENARAARASNRGTGLLGAYPFCGRFKSCITVKKKQIHLGMFDSAEAAHEAYVAAKRALHEGCTI